MPRSTNKSELMRFAFFALLAAVAVTAAACSSGSSASSTSTSATVAPAGTGSTSTSSGGAGTLTVSSGSASSVGTVLTGPNGHTLYRLTTETGGQIKCTGSCTSAWPPLTVTPGETPMLASGLKGTISTVMRPDGSTQVTYEGHPLYYYAADTSAGEAEGQGVGGVWFAMVPTASTSSSTPTTSTPTTSAPTTSTTAGGYSY